MPVAKKITKSSTCREADVNYCHHTYMFQLNYPVFHAQLKHVGMTTVIHVSLPTCTCFRDFLAKASLHPFFI